MKTEIRSNDGPPPNWALGARPTIAFLLPDTDSHWNVSWWRGAMDAARERDVNLICFPGNLLDRERRPFEAQANMIYRLLDIDCIDGLMYCV